MLLSKQTRTHLNKVSITNDEEQPNSFKYKYLSITHDEEQTHTLK